MLAADPSYSCQLDVALEFRGAGPHAATLQGLMGLMDTGLPPEEMAIIKEVLNGYAEQGMEHHALRTRQAGAWRFMSVHLLMPGDWTIARGHGIADHIEEEIRAKVPRLNVLTHLEPLEDPASWDDVEIERKVSPKK